MALGLATQTSSANPQQAAAGVVVATGAGRIRGRILFLLFLLGAAIKGGNSNAFTRWPFAGSVLTAFTTQATSLRCSPRQQKSTLSHEQINKPAKHIVDFLLLNAGNMKLHLKQSADAIASITPIVLQPKNTKTYAPQQ
jgi:hypothetical protein